MEVTCTHCGHLARLPTDKVPDRPFAFGCPKCKQKVRVDPMVVDEPDETEIEIREFDPLPPISPAEAELVAAAESLAFLVTLDDDNADLLEQGIQMLGFSLVRRFESLEDEEKKKRIFEKLTSGRVSAFLADAPVSIVVCGRKDVWDLPYDTSAAIENMLLMVTALDLGACWVIAPCIDIRDEERLKDLLGVPEGAKVVSIVAIGHPTRPHRPRPRLPLHELVFDEKWDVAYYEEEA